MSLIPAMLAAVTAPCAMPAGWDDIAARKTRYVVFGEMHGCQLRAGVIPGPARPITKADVDCAARPTKGTDIVTGDSRIALGALPPASSAKAYDGWVCVGAIVASSQAVEQP